MTSYNSLNSTNGIKQRKNFMTQLFTQDGEVYHNDIYVEKHQELI